MVLEQAAVLSAMVGHTYGPPNRDLQPTAAGEIMSRRG